MPRRIRWRKADLASLTFTREAFPLPSFGPILAGIPDDLENGRGIVLIRGIPVERYDEQTLYRLYRGIAVHLGDIISQNAHGLRDETLVIYSFDHGDNLGAQQLYGKSNMYEEAAFIPMIVAAPGEAVAFSR